MKPPRVVVDDVLEIVCVTVSGEILEIVCVIVSKDVCVNVICCVEVTMLVTVRRCVVVVCCHEKRAAPIPKPITEPIRSRKKARRGTFTRPPPVSGA